PNKTCRGRITTALDDTDVHVVNVHNHQPNAEIVPKRRVRTMLRKLAERGEIPQSEILKKIQDMEVAFGRSREQEITNGYVTERRYISRHMKHNMHLDKSCSPVPKKSGYHNYELKTKQNKHGSTIKNGENNKDAKSKDATVHEAKITAPVNDSVLFPDDDMLLDLEHQKCLIELLKSVQCSHDNGTNSVDTEDEENMNGTTTLQKSSCVLGKRKDSTDSQQFHQNSILSESSVFSNYNPALRGELASEIGAVLCKSLWPASFTRVAKLQFMRDVIDKILNS
ncbi:unnamed protein product, partial [Thelazia callipaeda]|uniref:FLYWCH-type domain-containing protein n=1 Tax=Thelazia callipaeda TaxID=103827 RepID=A0A0N5DBG2_THECL